MGDMKKFLSGSAVLTLAIAALALPMTANAAIWTSLLEYQDTGSGSLGPLPAFGAVTLEDLASGKDVLVTVHLTNPLSKFINTGGPHDPFLFNTMSDNQVTIAPPVGSFVDGGHGSFEATPFGTFTDKIGCCLYAGDVSAPDVYAADVYGGPYYATQIVYKKNKPQIPANIKYNIGDVLPSSQSQYGAQHIIHHAGDPILDAHGNGHSHIVNHAGDEQNGASAGQLGDLTFIVHNDAGITFAGLNFGVDGDGKLITLGSGEHFISNAGGWWFSADIFDAGTGLTYNVAARDASTNLVTTVPEPASWALMILGFGGVGAVVRRSRRLRRLTA
jgi:hypothetical protein